MAESSEYSPPLPLCLGCSLFNRAPVVLKAVTQRLSLASPTENHACLYDACLEAGDVY